jgi:hypothetical protein
MIRLNELKSLKQPTPEELDKVWQQTFDFATAIINKDLPLLEKLLHEEHTYFDTKSKWNTLKYFKEQFEKPIPDELIQEGAGIMICRSCQPGNPAVVFHNGYFPILADEENMPKAITLSFKDGKISDLTLCYGFSNADKLQELAEQN